MHTSFGQVIPFLGIYPRELTDIHWGTYLEICIEVIVCNSEKQKKYIDYLNILYQWDTFKH